MIGGGDNSNASSSTKVRSGNIKFGNFNGQSQTGMVVVGALLATYLVVKYKRSRK